MSIYTERSVKGASFVAALNMLLQGKFCDWADLRAWTADLQERSIVDAYTRYVNEHANPFR